MRLLTKILLALLIVSLFSAGGVALAQSSNSYDLGCWSVALGGGGERSSSNFRIVDSFGYWAHSGVQSGGTAGLRPGFIWAAPAGSGTTLASAAPALSAASPLDGGVLYLPIVSNYIRVVRTCPW
jgi:hypothetical protein